MKCRIFLHSEMPVGRYHMSQESMQEIRKTLLFVGLSLLALSGNSYAQSNDSTCQLWQRKVEKQVSLHLVSVEDLSQDEVFRAIECLLKLRGRTDDSNITGPTRVDVSTFISDATSVEVAALYYVSYLFKQNWGHSDAAFLKSGDGKKLNSRKAVSKAYKAYKAWFEKVKTIGLVEARKQKLDPLAGSGVSWY